MNATAPRILPLPDPTLLEIADAQDLNHGTTEAYPETLYRSVPQDPRPQVALDMGDVELLSSRGMRVLVNLKRQVERRRGRLILFRLQPGVRQQLHSTRLAKHFPAAADRASAVDLLRSISLV